MIKAIKFKTKRDECLTECPFHRHTEDFKDITIMVGSYACQECNSFLRMDVEGKVVFCEH